MNARFFTEYGKRTLHSLPQIFDEIIYGIVNLNEISSNKLLAFPVKYSYTYMIYFAQDVKSVFSLAY